MLPAAKSKPKNRVISLISISIVLVIFLSACNAAQGQSGSAEIQMAPMSKLSEAMQNAPVSVRESYQFALANPDVLEKIPCYCGCGSMGHTSNYDCYIQGEESGETQFDAHALGCGICVDITQDTMRMLKDGKSVDEIRTAVDAKYAQYGPSNMP